MLQVNLENTISILIIGTLAFVAARFIFPMVGLKPVV